MYQYLIASIICFSGAVAAISVIWNEIRICLNIQLGWAGRDKKRIGDPRTNSFFCIFRFNFIFYLYILSKYYK